MKLSEAITVIREEFVKLRSGVYRMDSVAEALSDFDRACAAAVRRWNEPGQRVKLMRAEMRAEGPPDGARYEKTDIARIRAITEKTGIPYPFLAERITAYKEWRDRAKRIDAILEASK